MTFNDFWNRYTSQRITDISDEVINFFSQPFSDETYEEYDLGEVVTEFTGHHETDKRFDKIEQFGRVLKANHPTVYAAEHIYVNDALVTYYCFRRNREGLSRLVPDFLAYPTANFDQLEVVFKRLAYHSYLDLAEEIAQAKYEEAQQDDDLFGGTAYEMGALKYYQLLSEYCRQAVEEGAPPQWPSFQQAVAEYGFELEEKHQEAISQGLTQNVREYVSRLRQKNHISSSNRSRTVLVIEVMFLREMQQYGMSFPTSGSVWSNLGSIWEGNRATRWEEYFHLTEATLRQLIVNRFGLFRDYRFEAALILWGSPYVVDFLHNKGVLTDNAYADQIAAIEKVKQGFKNDFSLSLWEYDFVHDWQPAPSVSPDVWQQEKEEFARSFELERANVTDTEKRYFYDPPSSFPDWIPNDEPVRVGPKIGRNDKVTVKYTDGTLKEGVKYKKVIDDIEAGQCELV